MRIHCFRPLRPEPSIVSELACVPYDTVDRDEAMALATPRSFLHVVRPDIDLPADAPAEALYAKAAKTFEQFKAEGLLLQDTEPGLFLYRQVMGIHSQRGVVACCDAEDYRNNLILKHEKTRRDKEEDRTRHVKALQANTGPVFLTYRDEAAIDAQVAEAERQSPIYDFTAADGVRHTVWRLALPEATLQAFERVPAFYIADGHHRAAAAARAATELAAQESSLREDEEYNRFLAVLFPGTQLKILPYNRYVHDLNELTESGFLETVQERFKVTSSDTPVVPDSPGEAGMYLAKRWFRLQWDLPEVSDPVDALDVSILQHRLLAPVLGIEDPRSAERISFVGGIRGTKALEDCVNSRNDGVAFSMAPVTVEQMMQIADAGREMPPKSTWFEPKLRSGLLVHPFVGF